MSAATTIVIFGASGDLTSRKLIPALFDNHRKGRLADRTEIVGFARRDMTPETFLEKLHAVAKETLGSDCDEACWSKFASLIHYCRGDIRNADDYVRLGEFLDRLEGGSGSGRLYYLAIAPELYPEAIERLGAAGMADEARGWRRIVIEKPFGRDLESAKSLNRKVHAVFDERQIYRIDHYLGKETVQNLLVFRFANTIFEPVWNRNYVDHVQITVSETVTVGSRGGYYDTAGVLRDMFQNHMLQVLTLIAMEPPAKFEADALRDEKVKVLDAVRRVAPVSDQCAGQDHADACSVLAQYAGYRNEPGVAADSSTATYAALCLYIDNWRWQGVPFYLRSGKGLARKVSEVIIQFLCPPHVMFDLPRGRTLDCNRLAITIQPDEGIELSFQTKVPDAGMALRSSELGFHYSDSYEEGAIPDAYDRLLLDTLNGDASLFIRSDEIELAWQLIDPIISGWERRGGGMATYEVGTWGPGEADSFIERQNRRWINDAAPVAPVGNR